MVRSPPERTLALFVHAGFHGLAGELERAGAREVGIGEHRPRVWASPGSAAMHHVSELQTVNDVAPREPEMNGSRFQGIREPEACLIRDRRSLQCQ